jgi:hypothetical protein
MALTNVGRQIEELVDLTAEPDELVVADAGRMVPAASSPNTSVRYPSCCTGSSLRKILPTLRGAGL